MGEIPEDLKGKILSIVNSADYIYLDDQRNQLAENGIELEGTVDVLTNSALKKLTKFDALILIHPDYDRTAKKQLYRRTIERVVQKCLEIGKPVICLRFDEDFDSGLSPFIFTDTIPYPTIEGDGDDPAVCQKEVDGIAAILQKEAKKLRIAWGGTAGYLCVAQWRDNTCRVTTPDFEGFTRHIGRVLKNPISYGESLPELVSF